MQDQARDRGMTKTISRRSLLLGAGAVALSQGLLGCRGSNRPMLRVQLLENAVPSQLLQKFQQGLEQPATLAFSPNSQIADIYRMLERWQQATTPDQSNQWRLPLGNRALSPVADLVSLSDAWLAPAIQRQLIQPLPLADVPGWQQLPEAWQAIVRRDRQGMIAATGDIWAAPYRGASLMLAYRVENFNDLGWTPSSWDDLWRPEVQGQVSLPDSARLVIGLANHRLGYSFNRASLDPLPELEQALQSLHQQVKIYSSDTYLQPLLLGDTWLAVGWSSDILPLARRDRRIAAVVPASGTLLSADVWVQPTRSASASDRSAAAETSAATTAASGALIQQWLEFCWQNEVATQLSLQSSAASPILLTSSRSDLPNALQQDKLLLPDPSVLEQSEFIQPLPDEALTLYRRLWLDLRRTES